MITDNCTNVNLSAGEAQSEQAPQAQSRRKGGRPKKAPISQVFDGFPVNIQEGAFCCVPVCFFDLCAAIDNFAELKIVQYIMRHTWGFKEYFKPKRITVDEFMHGRKRADGSRMDSGTGLSKSAVIDGLDKAQKHGFVVCLIDDRDRARVKHYYLLKIRNEGTTEPPAPTYFEDDVYPGQQEPDYPTQCEEQPLEETTDQQESDYPIQEDYLDGYPEGYDPYANTIFAQSAASSEEKIFVSKTDPITTRQGVNKPLGGAKQVTRSENRTKEITSRNNIDSNPHPDKNLEDFIRSLPDHQLPRKQKAPAFLRGMINDFSRDLGDEEESVGPNISRATKLYRNSGMNEEAFMIKLYEARTAAKKATQVRYKNKHGKPNRMPYFFKCLDGLLNEQAAAI